MERGQRARAGRRLPGLFQRRPAFFVRSGLFRYSASKAVRELATARTWRQRPDPCVCVRAKHRAKQHALRDPRFPVVLSPTPPAWRCIRYVPKLKQQHLCYHSWPLSATTTRLTVPVSIHGRRRMCEHFPMQPRMLACLVCGPLQPNATVSTRHKTPTNHDAGAHVLCMGAMKL